MKKNVNSIQSQRRFNQSHNYLTRKKFTEMNQSELLYKLQEINVLYNQISTGIAKGIENGNYGYISDKVESSINLAKHVLSQAKFKKKQK